MKEEIHSVTGHMIISEMKKAIVGQDDVLEHVLIALMAGGHALIEGVPGTGKTLLIRALAHITDASYNRIQFTPDLMPSDIIGVNIYDPESMEFKFRQGPVFNDFILADEINRSPAKTQSALLEAMEEKQVTVDGNSYLMSQVFSVFATQNPVEFEGTYPLPEAQLDRFMLKIQIDYPSEGSETMILDKVEEGFDSTRIETAGITKVLDLDQLVEMRKTIRGIHVEKSVRQYIATIIRATRSSYQITIGASPRAGVMLLLSSKAKAYMMNRDFVTPDDVKAMAFPVLRHRIILMPEAEVEGQTSDDFINDILLKVEVPR